MTVIRNEAGTSGRLTGLPPVLGDAPRVLVLGSMPGEASLRAGEYYAHPRNRFWPVAGRLLGFAPTLPYGERLAAFTAAGAALWDTIGSCERTGSLDSAILRPEANPVAALLKGRPTIVRVLLNGGLAARMWRRYVVPELSGRTPSVLVMPSTSPANARWTLEGLLDAWRDGLVGP